MYRVTSSMLFKFVNVEASSSRRMCLYQLAQGQRLGHLDFQSNDLLSVVHAGGAGIDEAALACRHQSVQGDQAAFVLHDLGEDVIARRLHHLDPVMRRHGAGGGKHLQSAPDPGRLASQGQGTLVQSFAVFLHDKARIHQHIRKIVNIYIKLSTYI